MIDSMISDEKTTARLTAMAPAGFLCGKKCFCRRDAWLFFLVLVLLWPVAGMAQRAVVLTSSLAMTRQSTRIYAHSVDFSYGEALPGPARLPGSSVTGPLLAVPEINLVLANSGPGRPPLYPDPGHPDAGLTLLSGAPFEVLAPRLCNAAPGWRDWAADAGNISGVVYVALLAQQESDGTSGQISLLRINEDTEQSPAAPLDTWATPGPPVTAVLIPTDENMGATPPAVAVLCRGHEDVPACVLLCRPGNPAPEKYDVNRFSGWSAAYGEPVALGRCPVTGMLFAALSGRALDRGAGEPTSLVYLLDSETGRVHGPVTVQGAILGGGQGLHFGAGACWIAATAPGSDFGYVTRIRAQKQENAGWTLVQDLTHVVQGASNGFLLTADPVTGTPAVSIGSTLELWPDGQRGVLRAAYAEPLRLLRWTEQGLFAGEGARIHLVNPITGMAVRTVDLRDGVVAALVSLSPAALPMPDADGDGLPDSVELSGNTSPTNPDTDGDGIHDGVDPEPNILSPRLSAPPAVVFQGQAAGRELRALPIGCGLWPGAAWRVSYETADMPWLVAYPLSGQGPGIVYLGIDPAHCPPGALVEGHLQVFMGGVSPAQVAANSLADVLIRVLPVPARAPTILWVFPNNAGAPMRDPADPRGLKKLADRFAGLPFCFSHAEIHEPLADNLTEYKIVAITTEALLRGMVARQVLVDYVRQGGGLLIAGDSVPSPELIERLSLWLAPFGLTAAPAIPSSGPCDSGNDTGLLRHWKRLDGTGAFRVAAMDASSPQQASNQAERYQIPEAGDLAHFLALLHGYGRLAVMASDRLLREASQEAGPACALMDDLFRWLSQAGLDASDMDNDGLVDMLEDYNNNGVYDPGETDWLRPDSDADGLPEGVEDRNRNGRVDPGETDPRNPDSDGDGFLDGADSSPAPPPAIPTINPGEGLASGV